MSVTPGRRSSRWTWVQSGSAFRRKPCLLPAAGIEHRLQHALAQRLRQRPGKPRRGKTVEGERHGAAGNAERARDRPVAGTAGMLQAQDLAHTSHRHSLGWHRLPHPSLVRDGQEAADPPSGRATTTPRVADFKSEWPTSRRNRWPASSRNQWPTCPGISKGYRPAARDGPVLRPLAREGRDHPGPPRATRARPAETGP